MNNQLFGNDSFDLTGNHNQKVDIRNELATERAAKYILIDASVLESDEDFELTVALEPFLLTDFWRIWLVLMYLSYSILFYMMTTGVVMGLNGKDVWDELAKKTGLLAKFTWALEMLDMYKDYMYLFAFYHKPWASILLIASIVVPFALSDWLGSDEGFTFLHNVLNYIGLTDDETDKELRIISVFLIAALENIPQFIIVVYEIFDLKQTVTFNQAGNPIFALCMTYKAAGKILGWNMHKVVSGRRSDIFEKLTCIVFPTLLILPQIIAYKLIVKHMVSYEQIPTIYFAEGLMTEEDPQKVWIQESQLATICILSTVLPFIFAIAYVIKSKLKNKN